MSHREHLSAPPYLRERVRGLREAQGLTQQQLAERAHVGVASIHRVEAGGGAGAGMVCRLAAALHVSTATLLDPDPRASSIEDEALLSRARGLLRLHRREFAIVLDAAERLASVPPAPEPEDTDRKNS